MPAPATPSPAAAWQLLAAGNTRFVEGTLRHPHSSPWRRQDLTGGQQPFAAVLSCADSRVSPEIAFDRGLGDLFVVRNAGHVLDEATLGTLEYAVVHVKVPLLAVMGHEGCGCLAATVAAAESGQMPGGHIDALVTEVMPSVQAAREIGTTCMGEIVEEHVRRTMRGLLDRSPDVAAAVRAGDLALVGLTYRLADGAVRLLDWIGDLAPGAETGAAATETERAIVQDQAAAAREVATQAAVLVGGALPTADAHS